MKQEEKIENKIAETLNSLGGLGKAEAKPFFYRRLEARMERELLQAPNPRFAFISNLRLNVALLALFAVFNVFTFFTLTQDTDVASTSREDQIESLAQEYFSGSDDYEYLNNY